MESNVLGSSTQVRAGGARRTARIRAAVDETASPRTRAKRLRAIASGLLKAEYILAGWTGAATIAGCVGDSSTFEVGQEVSVPTPATSTEETVGDVDIDWVESVAYNK